MNVPSLQRLTLISLFIHFAFFTAASLTIKRSNNFVAPSPYTVSLVGDERKNVPAPGESAQAQGEDSSFTSQNLNALRGREEQHVSEAIYALEAKKKVEKIVRMRNIISLKKSRNSKAPSHQGISGKKQGSVDDGYYTHITKEIWKNWAFPETGNKNLEAVVSIKILKDGSIEIKGVDKSSGNSLFDRSAIRAITKSSPLTPPPHEMEIGVRFYP